MRKEAEILLKQISELAFQITSANECEKIEELIIIYYNFFDQLTIFLKNEYFDDIAKELFELNIIVENHLKQLSEGIRQEIFKTNLKENINKKFDLKSDYTLFDKKI